MNVSCIASQPASLASNVAPLRDADDSPKNTLSPHDRRSAQAHANYDRNHPIINDLRRLQAAFESGDKSAIQSILAKLKDVQDPKQAQRGPNFAENHPIINDLETLRAAAQTNDRATMKADFLKLMSDIDSAQAYPADRNSSATETPVVDVLA